MRTSSSSSDSTACRRRTSTASTPKRFVSIRSRTTLGAIGRWISGSWPMRAAFLENLANDLPRKKRDKWVAEIAAARQSFEKKLAENYALGVKHSQATGVLHQEVLGKEVHDFLYKGDIDPRQTV